MDILTFIANMTSHLVWPITILIIVLIAKPLAESLIPKLSKLSIAGVEAMFQETLVHANETLDLSEKASSGAVDEEIVSVFRQLAGISPHAAVLEAWRLVEVSIMPKNVRNKKFMPRSNALKEFLGSLEDSDKEIFNDLRRLRNEVAHSPEAVITRAAAEEYASVAVKFSTRLNDLAITPTKTND